jgi:hypothetical protein
MLMDINNSRDRARQFHANAHNRFHDRNVSHGGLKGESHFQPPKVVSANEEQSSSNTAAPLIDKPPKKKRSFKQWLKNITKKQWIIISIVAALVLGGAFATWWFWLKPEPQVTPVVNEPQPEPKPKSTTVASNLSGLQVDPSVNKRAVTGIMIENSQAARPQSGLSQASVVFEAIAEGGITRFLAMYQDNKTGNIGPVRSARKPFLQWLLGFDSTIAHVGGSAEALQLIRDWNIKDLDQFVNSGGYWRIESRSAPHNVYTSIANLNTLEKEKGFGTAAFTSLQRKATNPASKPQVTNIDLDISSSNYAVNYKYNKSTNSYLRSEGGEKHMDANSNKQLSPKVVVVPVMTQGMNGPYYTYETIGSGAVYIFQDGRIFQGTWHKSSNEGQFTFKDKGGKAIKLNPGQTWFTVVGSSDRVSYN